MPAQNETACEVLKNELLLIQYYKYAIGGDLIS